MPYEFQCSDVIPGCEWKYTGETQEDTVEEIERHAANAHGMAELPKDVRDDALAAINLTGQPSS